WVSDDVDAEQVLGDRWYPAKAVLRMDSSGLDLLEGELARRGEALAAAPETIRMAREILRLEMVGIVDYHLLNHNLPATTQVQFDRLISMINDNPHTSVGQVIAASWRAARDAAAAFQRNRPMSQEKAVSHAVNQMAKYFSYGLDPYNLPAKYQLSATTLLVVREILGRDFISATLDSLPDPESASAEQEPQEAPQGDRLGWRLATLAAGTDPDLSSVARGIVEEAARVFEKLVSGGMEVQEATSVAYHGLVYLEGREPSADLLSARTLLRTGSRASVDAPRGGLSGFHVFLGPGTTAWSVARDTATTPRSNSFR